MHRSGSTPTRRILPRAGLAVVLAVAGQLVLLPGEASAATITVSSTADVATNFGACGSSSTTPTGGSLREAICAANNAGATSSTITVPAGTYHLTSGELQMGKVAGSNITINGAGAGSTIIDAGGLSRVFNLDPLLTGGVTTSLSGVTISGGNDTGGGALGGAGIIAGSGTAATGDNLTISSSTLTNNHTSGLSNVGGGLQFIGGVLSITNSTVSSNSTAEAPGSGVFYEARGTAPGEGLTVSGTTFSGNSVSNSTANAKFGGALTVQIQAGSPAVFNVSNSRFINNTVTATGTAVPVGAGVYVESGTLNLTGSTFTGNSVTGGATPNGGGIAVWGGTANLHYNRFTGNIAATGSAVNLGTSSGAVVDATDNWWGCNTGPGTAGCDTATGGPTVSPRLVLTATASPATVIGPNATATITAALTTDSLGGAIGSANLGAFAGLAVGWSDPQPSGATVGSASTNLSSGSASTSYNSQASSGPGHVLATLDNGTATATITVDRAPTITSANTASFTVGTAGAFSVTTTGYPAPAISKTGTVPAGLSFTDNGNGTATLSGTPSAGSGGTYSLSLTANNGVAPNATQTLTVTVLQAPAFTSAATATFTAGTAGTFSITTSGFPTVSTITKSGTLPSGITFTDNGNGTATLAGTPAAGSGGTYPVTLTASNGVSPNGTQSLSIQVNQAPAITTNPSDQTVNPGSSVSFIAAASGVPTPTVQWQRSTDGGASFTNIAGATSTTYTFSTVASDNGNQYRAVFTNVAGSATTTAATLSVGTAPTFTSADHTTFAVGSAGSFAITTSGVPNATISRTGTFPAWLTLTDNGDGTGSLTGTPPVGSGGTYTFTLKAANGFSPSASQTFTLFVDESPTITSADHTTFSVGTAGTFAVTTTAGFPTTTALSETGALPSGVTFTDNGDGTATLSGTPAAGTSGSYPITISAAAVGGVTTPTTQSFTLTVNGAPTITSADHATFAVGSAGTFTVTTTSGSGPAVITETGALPSGVSFTDNGDGTATLAGTPAAGTGGTYSITIKASNGISPDATQAFTLTVNQPPTITSTNHATFTTGVADAFTVTTAPGQPAATVLTETGSLPAGISFTDNGDGTATLGGTATAGGVFSITIKASNGVAPDATQAFTLTVNQPPSITSADHTTFTVGSAGTFTVTTTPGTPSATTITETGALPSGVSFTDNGDGTATLAGTPAAGQGGTYALTIKADNGIAPAPTQAFTLTVNELPAFTSADHATFGVGTAGSFSVTTHAGFPTATTLTAVGTLPVGVSFTDNGDGTATLAGTPAAGSAGSYPLTLTATNTVGHVDQAFTLTVSASPTITSADHVTFTVGTSGTFTVTTSGGFPTPPALTETGALPSGVTFHDNGNGTATLSGTPTVGGVFALTITANNGVAPATTQSFTLTVNGPPVFTSANITTFTAGLLGVFKVTTQSSTGTVTLKETGALPKFVVFLDNHNGTAYLTGIPLPSTVGTYHITITATNSVGTTTQAFTLLVKKAAVIALPKNLPPSNGVLGGVPTLTTQGQVLHLNGDGFAAGAPLTVGYYAGPKVILYSLASPTGSFAIDIQASVLGSHTFVVAGVGSNGQPRFLEAASQTASASSAGLQVASDNARLALTGPGADLRVTAGYGLAAILAGLALMVVSRRRRRGEY